MSDGQTAAGWEDIASAVRRAERTRLADALHDDALPLLAVARQELLEDDPERAREAVEGAIAALRSLVGADHDESLAEGGAAEGIGRIVRDAVRRRPMELRERLEDVELLPAEVQLVLDLVRELVANVVVHAEAHTMEVVLRREEDRIVLEVGDDGRGMDPRTLPEARDGHLGLRRLRRRLEARAGRLEILSAPERGTRVRVSLPLEDGGGLVNVSRLLPDTPQLLQAIADGWKLLRPDGTYVHVSDGACRLLERGRAQLLGTPLDQRDWWTEPERMRPLIDGALATGYGELVTRMRTASGAEVDVEVDVHVLPTDDGGEPLLLALMWLRD